LTVRMIVRTGAKAGFSEPQTIFDIVCDNKLSYHRDNRVYSWLEILSNQLFATSMLNWLILLVQPLGRVWLFVN